MSARKPAQHPAPEAPPALTSDGSVFRSAFESCQAVMYLLDPHSGAILDANPAACAFYDIPREDLRGMHVAALSTLPMRKIKSILADIRKRGGGRFASRHRLRDGGIRDVDIHATLITLSGGRDCVFVIVHDISARIKAERSLREREGLLRAIMDSASDGIGFKDRTHVYREANPAFCQLLGRDCRDVLGRKSEEFFDRRRNDLHVENDRRVMRENIEVVYETLFDLAGRERILSVHKAPVIDAAGDCLGVVFITHDVTGQRRAEAALRESEGRLRAMLQSAQDSIFVTDAAGLLREANPAFCELVDRPRETLLGKPLSAVFEPGELNIQESTGRLAMETQGPVNFTQRIQRPGRDTWVNVVKTPVIDPGGACLGVVSMGRDITAQKTAEIALRESERRLAALVHQSPVGVLETDERGRLTFANERLVRLSGRSASQLLGSGWLSCIHPEDHPAFVAGWEKALAERAEFVREARLRSPRGTFVWAGFLMRPLRDASGRVAGYLGAVTDTTERKKAEDLREDVEKIIRHDLKSPLGAMGNAAELLEMTGPLNAEQTHVLDELRALVRRMLGLVGLSLDMRAMENGQYLVQPAPVDLEEVLAGLGTELRPLVDGKGLAVDVTGADGQGPFLAMGERRLLETVFANLLKNAAEASPEGGRIGVRLWREGKEVAAAIRNAGEVPADMRERFFEKYATSGKTGGTGLGTYSARLMVRTLGGGILLDVSEPGHTTLTVRMPAA